ncbi:MAG: ABC transporter ATP-binding protein [Anaerolineae bacterium]|nr:ABC transporter ATP-binding protein [Anaerolineae bacterium]RIK19891.1 MAG: dipeptide/oligopeptide/nickel ABC transporter ATP-binding protein [Anaerolineae bacterium]
MEQKNELVLKVRNLRLYFNTRGGPVQAVDGVDFDLRKNEATVIIGESGCGKSSLAKAILRLLPRNAGIYDGEIWLHDQNIMTLDKEAYRKEIRWKRISMVPQAAMNALNPVMKIGDQVAEPAMIHMNMNNEEATKAAVRMLEHVGVPIDFLHRYSFELSGGMRQRSALAMALVTLPDVVILDEPTSALDVLTQASIMNLMKRMKHELETAFILITHDIATSSELADNVAVMYAGQVVEVGDARRFFTQPLHPYSHALMASVPRLREVVEPEFISGQPPSLLNPPTGCRFKDRCPKRFDKCDEEPPTILYDVDRKVKCWLYV